MQKETLVIPEIFSHTVSRFSAQVALQLKKDNQWQRFTYRKLQEHSLKLATFLVQQGFRKTDTACLISENCPEWAIMYLGIIYAGLICVPLDPQLTPQEIKNLIEDSSAKIIFCAYEIYLKKIRQNIQDNFPRIALLDIPGIPDTELINFSDIERMPIDKNVLPDILPEDIASLIYTSGTTGTPKGVLLSHGNLCSNFRSIARLNICFSSDNMLAILPLHHTYAFMVTLILPLFQGATVTYGLSLKSQDLSQLIREAKVSILVGVPQLFSLLHKAIFERLKKIPFLFLPLALLLVRFEIRRQWGRSLRLLASGGARLEPKIARDLSRVLGVRIIEGYGLTETSPVVTLNPAQKIKLGSVGKPIPGVQIKILEPDRKGIGQVLIKGENVMQGYFKHPEWTKEVIKEGWFYSGDLGYIDSQGYLFLIGRKKEIIVLSSGKNIYPEELEEYYGKSPYIKELCILDKHEEKFGSIMESLQAIVVPNLEYFRQRNEMDILGKIRWELENIGKNLPSYQHIMGFTVTREELPRTALKKLKRYLLKEKYLQEMAGVWVREPVSKEEDLGDLNKEIARKVMDYLSGQLNKPVYLESHLEIDLGIDSLTRVELGLGLEKIFNLKIPDEFLYSSSTVKEVIINISGLMDRAKAKLEKTEEMQRDWRQILAEPAKEKILQKIRIEPRLLDKLFTLVLQGLLLFIFRLFWFLRIEKRSPFPLQGPYIICSNHASYLDAFVIFSSLRFKQSLNLFFLGYSEILEQPFVKWAARLARLISIDPSVHLTEAMQASSYVLTQKKLICIFPEGRRSIDENIGEFKKGIGILIKELGVSVIPVYIKGSHYAWPRIRRLPRFYPLKIIFGRPFSAIELLEGSSGEPPSDDYAVIARRLREEVTKLAC